MEVGNPLPQEVGVGCSNSFWMWGCCKGSQKMCVCVGCVWGGGGGHWVRMGRGPPHAGGEGWVGWFGVEGVCSQHWHGDACGCVGVCRGAGKGGLGLHLPLARTAAVAEVKAQQPG